MIALCRLNLNNFCKMRPNIRAHGRVVLNRLSWARGQTRFYLTANPLLTLDPGKISSLGQVPREVSQLSHVSYSIHTHGALFQGVAIRYTTQQRLYIPFPDNTRGFLYYKGPKPGHPDIAGSLRFRVVSGLNPYSFANGIDLKLPTGGIWEIHLYSVVRTARHVGLLFKLLEDGLISPSVVEKLRNLPNALLRGTTQILYKLEDPFVARLHSVESLVCMTEESVEVGQIMPMFLDTRLSINIHPYQGFVLARFERSTLVNTRTIVLRILKELSPIQCVLQGYDSYIAMPTPGQLLCGRYFKGGRHYRPWSSDLDKGKGKAARMISLLWSDGNNVNDTT